MEKTGWMRTFRPLSVAEFCDGEPVSIGGAFIWSETDQGDEFWLLQSVEPTIECAKALLEMVQYWKEQQTVAENYEAGLSGKESV